MTTTQPDLPPVRHVPAASLSQLPPPKPRIRTEEDIETWRRTRGYHDYGLFLRRLNDSVVGYFLPWSSPSQSNGTTSMLYMLEVLDKWVDEIPPLPTPQRFGNLAFRSWGKRLEDQAEGLMKDLLPSDFAPAVPHLTPYLLTSFGSFTRMDYGTGHEASFAFLLLGLTLLRFFEPKPDTEREIVLLVFTRYLHLCWKLQDVYNLEPAGSHGVWGLDDYSFLSYIFGSAQLRDQSDIPVSAILHPPLPPTNLFFLSISRIHQVKHGPFHEHSSQLYSIATGVPRWSKVNSGLFKMYEAEVLGKRVVVQHIPLGGLIDWDVPDSSHDQGVISNSSVMQAAHHADIQLSGVQAPWSFPASTPPYRASPAGTHNRNELEMPSPSSLTTAAPWPVNHVSPHGQSRPPSSTVPGRRDVNRGPITPGQVPLGPLASTTLRPTSTPRKEAVNEDKGATK